MIPFRRIVGPMVLAGIVPAAVSLAQEVSPVFRDDFNQPQLDPAWVMNVSEGNTVALKEGFVEIRAAENTHAHLERRLGRDHVRASCVLRPGSGVSWCTSLFLYWTPADWCQIGVIPRGDGRYYVCVTTGGRRNEHDLTRCRFGDWHHVAIELGEGCIRFLSSPGETSWRTELFLPRPPSLMGPPALLVVGKGFGLDAGQPDLDGDYGERGEVAVSKVRSIVVEPTAPGRMRITPEEIRAREAADRDPLGMEILERPGDPDFVTVASKLPSLAKPREVVGIKDHPYEVGVDYDGTIQLADDTDFWEQTGATAYFEIGSPPVRFGSTGCRKRLLNRYLPIVICDWEHGGLRFEETVLGWSEGQSDDADLWALAALRATNPGAQDRTIDVSLRLKPAPDTQPVLYRTLTIPAGGAAELCAEIPSPLKGRQAGALDAAEFTFRLDDAFAKWTELLDSGMQIDVPEQRVNDACRAWLAYNYLNVDKKGDRYEPHDGGGFYEQVYGYSAVLYCHALDLWGRHEDARRYLESLLTLQKPDGLFFINYGMPDHGALLFALSEHYRLTGDAQWLRQIAPKMVRMCDWIIDKRKDSMRQVGEEKRPVSYGLIRFTPYADFQSPTCNYYGDAYCCAGLEHTAQVFREVGLADEAERLSNEAAAYRTDILASMDAAVIERDGMKLLPIEPDTHRLLESTRYRGGGYYGLVASMLLEAEFLPADDERARWVTDCLERRGGLILGMCEFDDGVDHAYTYGYWLNCLRRGEIRRVLLGFYGTLAYGMGRDTYCGVEVTQIVTGEPTPTSPHLYSGTQQLRLLRMMLLHEDGDELVIGKAIPRSWLEPGKCIEVRDAPTTFGAVSFKIQSEADRDRIIVQIDPPTRRPPQGIRLRVRDSLERPIRQVLVDGNPSERFNGETVLLGRCEEPVLVELTY